MKTYLKASVLLIFAAILQSTETLTLDKATFDPVVTQGDNSGTCPSQDSRQVTIERIQNDIKSRIPVVTRECGDGLWYRIAYFDMKDSNQKCPSAWREYTRNSARVCGRPNTVSSSCPQVTYTTGRQYSKVCGKIIGYQVASPDGFAFNGRLNQAYVDGISVTNGNLQNHIWTFAVGVTENSNFHFPNNCPCWDDDAKQPPSFVGNNYYCESGNPSNNWRNVLYNNDKLWDGQQCDDEGNCCSSAPWFNVELANNSTDTIEVRICGNEGTTNEDSPIELLEIYIQ